MGLPKLATTTRILILGGGLAVGGCTDQPTPSSPEMVDRVSFDEISLLRPDPPSENRTAGAQPILSSNLAPFPTFDAKLAEVAAREPSFAGVYRARDGEVTILLTDPARAVSARSALAAVMNDDRLSTATRVESARHPFDRLFHWKTNLAPVLTLPGAISLDIDESRNRITIGIDGSADRQLIAEAVKTRGIPLDAVAFLAAQAPSFGGTLHDGWRPVRGGPHLEGSGTPGCTLGFNADLDGTPVFATNGHCTETIGGTEGSEFGQNDYPSTSDFLGTEYFEEATFSSTEDASCPSPADVCKYTEIALGAYDDPDDWHNGYILRPVERDPASSSVVVDSTTLGIYTEELWPLQNDVVEKIGRTTGWTYGEVDETCATKLVIQGYYLLCTYSAEAGGDLGDSGAGVFIDYSGDWMDIVGQFFAFDSTHIYFTPWNSIQVVVYNEFSATLDVIDW